MFFQIIIYIQLCSFYYIHEPNLHKLAKSNLLNTIKKLYSNFEKEDPNFEEISILENLFQILKNVYPTFKTYSQF